jgi:hypothetical protein
MSTDVVSANPSPFQEPSAQSDQQQTKVCLSPKRTDVDNLRRICVLLQKNAGDSSPLPDSPNELISTIRRSIKHIRRNQPGLAERFAGWSKRFRQISLDRKDASLTIQRLGEMVTHFPEGLPQSPAKEQTRPSLARLQPLKAQELEKIRKTFEAAEKDYDGDPSDDQGSQKYLVKIVDTALKEIWLERKSHVGRVLPSLQQKTIVSTSVGQAITTVGQHCRLFPKDAYQIILQNRPASSDTEQTSYVDQLDATDIGPVSNVLLYHLLGDPIGTEYHRLTGYQPIKAWIDIRQCFEGILGFGNKEFTSSAQRHIAQIDQGREFIQSLTKSSNPSEMLPEFKRMICSLPEGQSFILPSGWTSIDGGHSIVLEVKNTAPATFQVIVYNAGDGIEYHFHRIVSGKIEVAPLILNGISLDTLSSLAFLYTLRTLLLPGHWRAEYFYTTFLASLDGSVDQNPSSFGEIQRSGTCAFASLLYFLHLTSSITESDRIRVALGYKAIDRFIKGLTPTSKIADHTLADCCLRYFAQWVVQAHANRSISSLEVEELQRRLEGMQITLLSLRSQQAMKEFALPVRHHSDSRDALPLVGSLYLNSVQELPEGNVVIQEFPNFPHARFVPLSGQSEGGIPPTNALLPMDLSTPQAIADAAEKAFLWADSVQQEGNAMEAHFGIEQFSQLLADASHSLHERFREHPNEADRLAIACEKLGTLYAQTFWDRCVQMQTPAIVSPLTFATMANLIYTIQSAFPDLDEIKQFPLCLGECVPNVVGTEDFQHELRLYDRLHHLGVDCELTHPKHLPRDIISFEQEDSLFTPFLRILHQKYGEATLEQFRDNTSFTLFTPELRALHLLTDLHKETALSILPPSIFCIQHLDNLVYLFGLYNRAENPREDLSVSWTITHREGHPVLKKTPPSNVTYITYTTVHPSSRFRPRPEPCATHISDSYATTSYSKLAEHPHVALHALSSNHFEIDEALSTFSAHPKFFQEGQYRTLFEHILYESEKIALTLRSPILRTSVFRIVPFLEHQADLATVNKNTAILMFCLRQFRLLYERVRFLIPEEESLPIRSRIALAFASIEKYLFGLSSEEQHLNLFAYHSERARFFNAAPSLSDEEIDLMMSSALIAQRTSFSQAPLLEYETQSFLHGLLQRKDVNTRLVTSPDTALNKSLPLEWQGATWKHEHNMTFICKELGSVYHLSTAAVYQSHTSKGLVDTPAEFFQDPSIKDAIRQPLPLQMYQEGPRTFSFEVGTTPFKISYQEFGPLVYKRIEDEWYQHITIRDSDPWHESSESFIQNVIQGHSAWLYDNGSGTAVIRIENEKNVPLFEAVQSTFDRFILFLGKQKQVQWTVYVCNCEGKRTNTILLEPSSLSDNWYCFEQRPYIQAFSTGSQVEKIFFQKIGKEGLSFTLDPSIGTYRWDGHPEEVLLQNSYLSGLPKSRHKLLVQNEKTGQKSALIPAHRLQRTTKGFADTAAATFSLDNARFINPLDTDDTIKISRNNPSQTIPLFVYPIQDKRLIPNSAEERAYLAYAYLLDHNYEDGSWALSQIPTLSLSSSTIQYLKWLLQDSLYDNDPRAVVLRLKALSILKNQSLLFHIATGWEHHAMGSLENYAQSKHLCGSILLTNEEIEVLYKTGSKTVPGPIPLLSQPLADTPTLPLSRKRTNGSPLAPDITKESFETIFQVLKDEGSSQSGWETIRTFSREAFSVILGEQFSSEMVEFQKLLWVAAHNPISEEQKACALLLAVTQRPDQFQGLSPSDLSEISSRAQSLLELQPQPIHQDQKEMRILLPQQPKTTGTERPPFVQLSDPGAKPLLPNAITATKNLIPTSASEYVEKIVRIVQRSSKSLSLLAQQACTEFSSQVEAFQQQAQGTYTFTLNRSDFDIALLKTEAQTTAEATDRYKKIIKQRIRKKADGSAAALNAFATRAGFYPRVDLQDVIYALLQPFPHGFLQLNPALTDKDAQDLYEATINYLINKTFQNHIQATILKATQVAGSDTPSQEELQGLSALLSATRGYDPIAEPALLIFEAAFGQFLWPDKVAILRRFLQGDVEAQGKVIELIMASGKTAVLLPLVSYLIAQRGMLSVVVLPDQLFPSMAPILAQTLQKSFGIPVFSWKLQDDKQPGISSLKAIHKGIESTFAKHGVIILRPKDYTGLFLQFLSTLTPEGKEELPDEQSFSTARETQLLHEVKALFLQKKFIGEEITPENNTQRERQELYQAIFSLMVTHGAFLFDEVDTTWDVLKEHLLSVSSLVPIDAITRKFLVFLYKNLPQKTVATKEAFVSEVAPKLVEKVIESLMTSDEEDIRKEAGEHRHIVSDFLQGTGTKESLQPLSPGLQDVVSVVRTQIQDILPETCTKTFGIHYGEAPQVSGEPLVPYAIPYENGIPTQARFGHDLEEVHYTMQMFLHLTTEQLTPYVVQILKDLQFRVRQELIETPSLRIEATEGARWLNSFIGNQKIVLHALAHPETFGGEIARFLQQNTSFLIDFIDRFFISKIQRPTSYLHATTQIYALLANVVRAFSGTTWNKQTYPVPAESSAESVGKTISILTQEPDQTVLVVREIEDIVLAGWGIIDVGGVFTERDSREIAQCILDKSDPENIQGIVFYDKDKCPKVLHRKASTNFENVFPYEEETLSPEVLTAYWSQPFTTGSDLKIQSTAHCLVCISKDTIFRDVLQGVWRPRKFGRGQHERFVVTEQTRTIICEALRLPLDSSLFSHHIIAYTLLKQIDRQASDNCRSLRHAASAILERGFIKALLVSDPSTLDGLYESCSELYAQKQPQRLYDRYAITTKDLSADEAIESLLAQTLNSRACRYLCEKGFLDHHQVKAELNALRERKSSLPERIHEVIPEIRTKVQVQTQTQVRKQTQTQTQQELSEVQWTPTYRYSIVNDFESKICTGLFTTKALFQGLQSVQRNEISGACIRLHDLFSAEEPTKKLADFFPSHVGTTVNLHQAFQQGFTLMSRKGAYPAEYALTIQGDEGNRAIVLLSQEDAEKVYEGIQEKTILQTPGMAVCLINIHSGAAYPIIGGAEAASATQKDFSVLVDRLRLKIFDGDLSFTVEEKIGLLYIAASFGPDGPKRILDFVKTFSIPVHREAVENFVSLETLFADLGEDRVRQTLKAVPPELHKDLLSTQSIRPPYTPEFLHRLRDAYNQTRMPV